MEGRGCNEIVKKGLPVSSDIVINQKSIFNSDEEEEPPTVATRRSSRKRKKDTPVSSETEIIPDKNVKFDPQQFLAQIENASQLEARIRSPELDIVEYLFDRCMKD